MVKSTDNPGGQLRKIRYLEHGGYNFLFGKPIVLCDY